jgi:hypothetical protein
MRSSAPVPPELRPNVKALLSFFFSHLAHKDSIYYQIDTATVVLRTKHPLAPPCVVRLFSVPNQYRVDENVLPAVERKSQLLKL